MAQCRHWPAYENFLAAATAVVIDLSSRQASKRPRSMNGRDADDPVRTGAIKIIEDAHGEREVTLAGFFIEHEPKAIVALAAAIAKLAKRQIHNL